MAVPEDNPGNPWAPPWPDEIARRIAKRELRQMKEALARAKHPTARRTPRMVERERATG